MNHPEEIERLVVNTSPIANPEPSISRSSSQPIPANRLALDAQIQAAAQYQRRLRRRRRIYYILLITCFTMSILFILSAVAWIIHNSSTANAAHLPESSIVNPIHSLNAETKTKPLFLKNKKSKQNETYMDNGVESKLNHQLIAKSLLRPSPTRTDSSSSETESEAAIVHLLVKRSEADSDDEKDRNGFLKSSASESRNGPTRTHKISFRPEKIVDPMPRFRLDV